MASNEIPREYDPLIQLLEDAADGAATHGAGIPLETNTEARIRTDLVALVGAPAGPGGVPVAIPGLKALWNNAKVAKSSATASFRNAKSNGKAVARACVNVLKPRLGDSWTAAWQAAGFTGGSIAIPDNPLTLLQQLRAYFIANPTHEQTGLGNGFDATAGACEAAAQAISDASDASNQSNTDAGTAKAAYEAGIQAGRARLTGLRTELEQKIGDADPRWYAFGFERPSDPETPEVPENVTAMDGGSGTAFVDWDDARRAGGYRARVFRVATGEEVRMELVQDSDVTLQNLPQNEPLRIEITAYNEAGESQAAVTTITLS